MDMDMKIYSVKIDKVLYSLNNRAKGNLFTCKKIIIIMKIINKIKKQRILKRIKSWMLVNMFQLEFLMY